MNLNIDQLECLQSSASYANESDLQNLERSLVTCSPGLFALIASQGKWKLARHLVELDVAIVEAIEAARAGEILGLVVSMPPQHGKSELCSKYLPAWYLGSYPDNKVVAVGYEADFAAGWGRRARDLLEEHGHLFGVQVAKQSRAATRWEIAGHDGGMVTAGVGGPITGKGAHLLIIDDPIKNDEEARSSSFREKLWEWWQSVASTRIRPGGLFVIIQTRWHRDDLTGRLLRQDTTGRWRQIVFPALATSNAILGRQPGEALWPEMYPREKLLQVQQDKAAYYWRALYQQNPQAEGGSEWPQSYFGPSIWFNDWPTAWICKTMALDPSKGKESKRGDYSAFVMMMLGLDRKLYVDADLCHYNISILTDVAIEHYRRFDPDGFAIETNQFQELLKIEIERRFDEYGIHPKTYSIDNTVNKLVRIRRLSPYLAEDRLRFKSNSPGARLLGEQLKDFPNGDHDDGPSANESLVVATSRRARGHVHLCVILRSRQKHRKRTQFITNGSEFASVCWAVEVTPVVVL